MSQLVPEIARLRLLLDAHRKAGKTIGLVPTMGALHAGHRRLMEVARPESDVVVTTIFVNPTQFDRTGDLEQYPKTLDQDLALCREVGSDLVFAPTAAEMYPQPQLAWVDVPELTTHLCGAGRPGHFRGVATVVTKLLLIAEPDRAYFGEKDAQQLAVIRRLVRDLNIPVTVVGVPTVREPDGLAISSRNRHLNAYERLQARALSQALFAARDAILAGERSVKKIHSAVAPFFDGVRLEYCSIVDPQTLTPVEHIESPVLIAGAIWLGTTRLIDNVTVSVGGSAGEAG
ncbi:MAG: pantoate--beta-alanine ligase [Bryobacterales bacterium]|nr:pantoate--beta-alanine ligase [Bryobacterales bacterium]